MQAELTGGGGGGGGGNGGGPLVGSVWSVADAAVVPFVLRLDETYDLGGWPAVAAYCAWARTVPAVRAAWVGGWWWWW